MERERAGRRVAVLAVLFMLPVAGIPADDFGPWSADYRHPTFAKASAGWPTEAFAKVGRPASSGEGGSSSPFRFAFRVWSELLTRIDGPRCAHLPSCSVFAYQALRRRGMPEGVWLALNRLMRGARSSVLRALPAVFTPAGMKYLDPLP